MPMFEYTARNAQTGQIQKGQLDVPSKDEVGAYLRKNRMILVSVRETPKAIKLSFGQPRVKTRDIVIFTRQFATMINAGLPLVQSLSILAAQTENKTLAGVTRAVVYDVESGNTLADAFSKHPKAFTDLYVNMVAAGEAGGILDTILLRLAIFVIPTFQNMFASANLELPLPTRIVIGLSNFLIHFWWAMGLAIGGVIFAIKRYYATSAGRLQIDSLLLKAPVLGDVIRKSAVSRFTRTLGTLVSSGVSILEGLEITAKTSGNQVVHDAVMASRQSIAGGETIAAPLERSAVFPPMVISMIAVGEQTGGLDEMLSKIADFYDEEVDVAVTALLSLMEPVMIVILGVIVGGMVVAMYLPIFDMVNAVQ